MLNINIAIYLRVFCHQYQLDVCFWRENNNIFVVVTVRRYKYRLETLTYRSQPKNLWRTSVPNCTQIILFSSASIVPVGCHIVTLQIIMSTYIYVLMIFSIDSIPMAFHNSISFRFSSLQSSPVPVVMWWWHSLACAECVAVHR